MTPEQHHRMARAALERQRVEILAQKTRQMEGLRKEIQDAQQQQGELFA